MTTYLIAAVTALFIGSLAAAALIRRHRKIWAELFAARERHALLEAELVRVRKEIVLASVGGANRMPIRMPSQHGEDLLLWNFFDRKRQGFFVEVGAYDGIGFSNTYFFESIGWNGVLVEAVPELCSRCAANRPNSRVLHAAAGAEHGTIPMSVVHGRLGAATLSSTTPDCARIRREDGIIEVVDVPLRTLDEMLEGIETTIDFVSIDVEGAELGVLQGFDLEAFRPQVIVLEQNDPGDSSVRDYLAPRGYVPRFHLEQNVFYTHTDDLRQFSWVWESSHAASDGSEYSRPVRPA